VLEMWIGDLKGNKNEKEIMRKRRIRVMLTAPSQ
jgi:hypothetical protein